MSRTEQNTAETPEKLVNRVLFRIAIDNWLACRPSANREQYRRAFDYYAKRFGLSQAERTRQSLYDETNTIWLSVERMPGVDGKPES